MTEEIQKVNGEPPIKIHDYIQCVWENSNNFRRTWKLTHISDMYYYFRDTGMGKVTQINKDQFHSQMESGYYSVLQTQQE